MASFINMLSGITSDVVGAEPVLPALSKIITVNTDETLVKLWFPRKACRYLAAII
jgi:hypothetical protein